VISVVDVQARCTRKSRSKRRDGFRAHVAAEPDTGLITDCNVTMATGEGSTDSENGLAMAGRDRFHRAGAQQEHEAAGQEGEPGLQVYGDSAYGSGRLASITSRAGTTR
jgi:hypothetical protein